MKHPRRLIRDEHGSVLVEVSVMIPIIFIFLLGLVDFLNAFQQWNASTKAVEVGARLAAVSDPLAPGFNGLAKAVAISGAASAGSAMPTFKVVCDGSANAGAGACTCTGACTGVGTTINATAMNALLYGRAGNTSCNPAPNSYYFAGMCNFLPSITAANVVVTYAHDVNDRLGYAGRDGGTVATVTVALKDNLPFKFFFLGSLMSFADIKIPSQSTTFSGEAMSSTAQPQS